VVGHADWRRRTCAGSTAGSSAGEPGIACSQAFLDAYQQAPQRRFSPDEIEVSWAAGLWTRAFNAKKWHRRGYAGISRAEAAERRRRAGC
jgi:hypothetical protein